jgi:hypothetical protein
MDLVSHEPAVPALGARLRIPGWRWSVGSLYVAGIAGNVAVIVLYVVTRTIGIPLLGPEAGVVEDFSLISVLSKVAEVAIVALLVGALVGSPRSAPGTSPASASLPARAEPRRHNP